MCLFEAFPLLSSTNTSQPQVWRRDYGLGRGEQGRTGNGRLIRWFSQSSERYDTPKNVRKKEGLCTAFAGDNDTSAQQLINNIEREEAFEVR